MRTLKTIIAAGLLAALTTSAAIAQDQAASFNAQNATVHSRPGGQALTLPSQASAPSVVADFLRGEGVSGETVGSLVLQRENTVARTGLTHLRFEQQVDGLTVFGAYVKATVNGDGELVHLIEALATPGNVRPAVVGPREALDAALAENHPGVGVIVNEAGRSGNTVSFSGDDFFYRDPTATRVAIAMTNGSLQEGFLVETWSDEDNLLHHTLVGANGRVLGVQLRTNNDSYNIFTDHPGNSTQIVIDGPGNWLSGPQTSINISGNNAHAYFDTDANNSPDAGGNAVGDGNFLTSANLGQEPETIQNKEVAVQNLFYWNNVIHDKLYLHGFVESVGNFQEDNFGNGGAGSDSVNAEAQDGSGTNNANFATPSDGSNPRMQMFVWTQTTPKRDGDVDSDIIWHEYGHGLTWRMIGSMNGPMSGAIGEGMSDVLAILINDNDVVGEYSTDDPVGIRSAPYTNYPRTYGDFTGQSVHFDGEIYAATIWRLWEIFQYPANDVSQDTLFDYLIGGMNFTPAGPSFEDMRDGILQASAGTGHECLIWEAFAGFGVGVGAQGSVKGGGPFGGGKVTITEDFSQPAECSSDPLTVDVAIVSITADTIPIVDGVANTVTVQVTNNGTGGTGDFSVSLTDDGNPVGTQNGVTLAGGQTTNVVFDWTPTGLGNHSLVASHTLVDDDNSNDSATEIVTVTDAGDPGTVVVSDITPNSMLATNSPTAVTIFGSGFGADPTDVTVTFINGSGPAPTASIEGVIDGEIDVMVTVKQNGKKGTVSWDVVVTTSNGSDALMQAFDVTR
jgi:hypothetical protein